MLPTKEQAHQDGIPRQTIDQWFKTGLALREVFVWYAGKGLTAAALTLPQLLGT
jgi:hypothetical protein